MDRDRRAEIKKQILDLRVMFSQFTHTDDVRRMRDASETIDDLLVLVEALEASNKALRELCNELQREHK